MALHVTVFLTFVIAGSICCLVIGIVTKAPFNKLFVFGTTAFAGLILVAPFIWRYFAWRAEPGHNIGIPADIGSEWFIPQITTTPPLEWIIVQASPYHIVQAVICLLLLLGILISLFRWREGRALFWVLASAIALTPLFLVWLATKASWAYEVVGGTTATMSYISLGLLAAISLKTLYDDPWIANRLSRLRRPFSGLLLVALVLSPCIYYRICEDPQLLQTNYGLYAVTTHDDLRLMEWMGDSHTDLREDTVVLANAFEPGMFIPSLAGIKTVFPYTGSQNSVSYQRLVVALHEGRLDSDTFDIMRQFRITHVFVGSKESYWPGRDFKWDPRLFRVNPNFKLTKRFGDAYLFEFIYSDPDPVFSDDFQYTDLDLGVGVALVEGSSISRQT